MATSGRWVGRTDSPRQRRAGSFFLIGLKCLLSAAALGLVAWSLRDVELRRVAHLLSSLGPLAALVVLPQLAAFAVETWGWRRALRSAGHPVAFTSLFTVRIASEAVSQALPGGVVIGETLRPALLSRSCGLSLTAGVGATVHRKFLKVLAHGIYIVFATIVGFEALRVAGRAWTGSGIVVWVTLSIGTLLIVSAYFMAALLGHGRPAVRLHALLCRLPSRRLRRALDAKVSAFSESDRHAEAFFALGARRTALPVAACVVSWLCEALETWLMLALLGASLHFPTVLGVDMAVSLARQTLFLLPAGIGVQEAGYMGALGAIGVPDALTVGAAFIVLKRAKEVFWIVLGLFTLLVMPARGKRSAAPEVLPPFSVRGPVSSGPVSRGLAANAAPHSASG